MARPAKPIELQTRHNTKEEIDRRKKAQDRMKGKAVNVKPPYVLSKEQKKIFNKIKGIYEKSDVLGELDAYILAEAAVVIDRLQQLEQMINDNPDLLTDKDLMSIRKGYTQDYYRACNELGLSPQSRAKLSGLTAAKDKEESDPLLMILKDDEE
ncbi:MAG: phage terminase small subunit P27 family [Clostridia bacterium]|nr:phage terminase small subunit P27 family [Clostridia bacterium]MBR2177439.1 phage terminase small subunit P27 family [Clostridia bacterium]